MSELIFSISFFIVCLGLTSLLLRPIMHKRIKYEPLTAQQMILKSDNQSNILNGKQSIKISDNTIKATNKTISHGHNIRCELSNYDKCECKCNGKLHGHGLKQND